MKPAFQRCKWYAWARVYKRSIFLDNNIEFPYGHLYEDMSTIPAIYLKCKCIYGINKSLVWYRFHKKSITQTFREKDIFDLIYATSILSNISRENKPFRGVIYPTIHRILNLIKYTIVKNEKFKIPSITLSELRSSLMVFIEHFKTTKKLQIFFLPWYINTIIRLRRK